jgi:hypothetical protein
MISYCPHCGFRNEYSLSKPKFCGGCSKSLDSIVFKAATTAASTNDPDSKLIEILKDEKLRKKLLALAKEEPSNSEDDPASVSEDVSELAGQFAAGVKVDAPPRMVKIKVEDLINHSEMGNRNNPQTVQAEGVEVIPSKNDKPYLCLDPKNFPTRPAAPKTRRGRKAK